jgi:hypothetical protein
MAYKSSTRGTRPVRWIAIHTAEGARTAVSLGKYFYRDDIAASSHVGIDGGSTLQYVSYAKAAWTLRGGNPVSDNAEMCGFSRWTRVQWLSTGTVDGVANPRAMVRRCALWTKSRCVARGIPIRHLTPAQVAAGQAGIIAHWDYTRGTGDGTHTDVGTNFPWDVFFSDMNPPKVEEEDEVKPHIYKLTKTGEVYAVTPMGCWKFKNDGDRVAYAKLWGIPATPTDTDFAGWMGPRLDLLT